MTIGKALKWAIDILTKNSIDDSHIEARVLLGYILRLSSADLYTRINQNLTQSQFDTFQQYINRRINREPTAYIINNKEFYGIDFYVDHRVLIPRPETELLVEEVIYYINDRFKESACSTSEISIADIGTGCGAVAITLAVELPDVSILATDVSDSALEVARKNSKHHKVDNKITFLQGNLLEAISKPVDLIVANLPYIKTSELATLAPEIFEFEPKSATDGGATGIKYISELLTQTKEKIKAKGCILLEIGKDQEKQLNPLIELHIPHAKIQLRTDLGGINRIIKVLT